MTVIRAHVEKRYLILKATTDVTDNHFIFALVAIGNTIGNSQTEKQISKNYF